MLAYLVFCFLAIMCFAIIFNVPRSEFLTCGLIGTAGWTVSFFFRESTMMFFGIFLAACCITILSRIFARVRHSPLTVYLVPGILPLVPGGAAYNTMYAILLGEQASAALLAINTLQTAASICLGILTVFAFPAHWFDNFMNLLDFTKRT